MSARDDDELDDASMKSMRAVWLSMRDEEPPAAGMSALLAAARDKAEQMHEKPSWWQRLVTQVLRPPALATATVIVLIGGAVLVTQTSKQVETKVDSSTERAPATDELRVREVEQQQAAPVAEPEPPPVLTPPETTVVEDRPVAKPKRKPKPAPVDDDAVGTDEPTRNDRFKDSEAKPGFSKTEGKGDTGTELSTPGRATSSPPPEPVKPATIDAVKKPEPTSEVVVLSDTGTVKTPPNEQLARQAESAAARGDCPAVRVIVARMKKQDERFYKTRLGKNAAVTKCL
jgi:hypothetical protein